MTETFGNHIEWVDPSDLREALRSRSEEYVAFVEKIAASVPRGERSLAVFNLARAAGMQVERLHLWLDQGTDALAWCARNLFELDVIVRFVLDSDANLREWLGQRATDEVQFIDAFLATASDESAARGDLERRRREILRISEKHEIPLARIRSTQDLATRTGLTDDYDLVFKLLSKHVHPSSYLVNEDSRSIHGPDSINLFLTLAQAYAADIQGRVSKALELHSD